MIIDPSTILNFGTSIAKVSPSSGDLFTLFATLGKLPASTQIVIIKYLLDEETRKKLAMWAEAFTTTLNNVHAKPFDQLSLLDESLDNDFLKVMNNTQYRGHKLDFDTLNQASNLITKAIKAQNYTDAIRIGLALGQAIVV